MLSYPNEQEVDARNQAVMTIINNPAQIRSRLVSRIRTEFQPRQLLPSLTIGVVVGLVEVVVAISFAALIFSGELSMYIDKGIALSLIGAAISGTIVALLSTLPGTVGGNQDISAAVMAVIATGVAGALTASGAPEQQFLATILVSIATITLFTGVFFYFIGHFELGNLVRFLPYPVIGGFVAGTGWLLLTGALGLMTDQSSDLSKLINMLDMRSLVHWLPGLVFAVVMLILVDRLDHVFILPGIILLSILLFYIVVWLSGASISEVRAQGWLFGPFPDEVLLQPIPWGMINQVNWQVIVSQLPNIGLLILLSAVATLLNAGGLEVAIRQDVSLNRELRAAGLGNILAGFAGGLVGYQQISLSALRIKAGEGGRLVGLIAAGICLITLFVGATFLSYFPKVIAGGLLLYLGVAFLKEWVFEAWFRLPRIEYAIVLFILVVIATMGFLAGVAVGVVAAIIIFAVAYSRVNVVRNEISGQYASSRVSRSPRERQFLRTQCNRLHILKLQGFIFFGTAESLLNRMRGQLVNTDGTNFQDLLIDFQRVVGLDSTALRSLARLREMVVDQGGKILVTGATASIGELLSKGGLPPNESVLFFQDLDQGMAWYEDNLLKQTNLADLETPTSLVRQLADVLPYDIDFQPLLPYLERRQLAAGEYLIRQGDPPGNLYFVEAGQVSALLEIPDRPPLRLQTMGSGHVVGEIGFYLEQTRTASVVADEPSIVFFLTREALDRMEQKAPSTASALHRLIVHLVSERVSHLTQTIDALEH